MVTEEEGQLFLLKLTALLAKESLLREKPTAPSRLLPKKPQTSNEVWVLFLALAAFIALLAAVPRLIG